ncbi:MAG: patatin-like phospholipase family protein [Acidimicrobiales bacterium]
MSRSPASGDDRSTVPASDGLAVPRSFTAGHGDGVDRGLCLGGGGLFFVAWQVAYLHTLAAHGIDVGAADRVVGTSAGSMVASTVVVAGRLRRFHTEISLPARAPVVVSALAPASELRPSQQRALDLFVGASDAEPDTLREIGHAALAAATPGPAAIRRNISLVVGWGHWRSKALQITCVDAFTAERCVVTRAAGTTVARAVAAGSAVPGVFPPQPVGDRLSMDVGVSGTGTHLDMVAGARSVLVLALNDGGNVAEGMMTSTPGARRRELEDLRASGTVVVLRAPAEVDLDQLMAPASVPKALAMGARQAVADVGPLATFWR